ncbi:hypothetical protein BL250_04755 [Erwinia sp. OLTSP20]|nr:hypothetical protein BV501_12660 [Erwinia sp. OAMSP11]PIJ68967.1 hypothetical protein BK416_15540 [Erwinia sp. OLSSP12]PIJ80967.1 hypothetical protein BLD46_13455 [Erwinia sp. OLMTSP26]PIJ83370.1 hypothetical protein BLD49_13140 [Erwinia sp. OLMDSP33]PIJ84283.1 hypothetical protein BLD47_02775 [Erwinia sp. OLCASP19]PIJ92964.1 hypothetical protein BL249_05560 [Erwinia sp. OLFS4]PIJ93994.1 hypothetical protein BL250_04755 [Erwinia sp. OLTSP20]
MSSEPALTSGKPVILIAPARVAGRIYVKKLVILAEPGGPLGFVSHCASSVYIVKFRVVPLPFAS